MTIERINPPTLATPIGAAHVVVVTGRRLVFINGQVARDADGKLVGGGDYAAQAKQVFINLRLALAAVGATGRDVVQYRLSVVNYASALLAPLTAARTEVFADAPLEAAGILAGVTMLGRPEFLVEVEAIAAIP